jgi:hypothetical protein
MTLGDFFTALFILVWLAGVGTWFIGASAMFRWMKLRRKDDFRKFFKSGAIFVGFGALLFLIGGIASWLGVWA